MECRISGGDTVNQRGFIATDAIIPQQKQGFSFNTSLIYCHQCSILNFVYKDAFDFYNSQYVSEDIDGFPFNRYLLMTVEEYKPQDRFV